MDVMIRWVVIRGNPVFEDPHDAAQWLYERNGQRFISPLLRYGALFLHPESQPFLACVELAEILLDEVDFVSQLLLHHDWRNQVIGNVVAVINRDHRYEQAYVDKLTRGQVHFPSPLAAGWAIITTGETGPLLENHLLELSKRLDKSHDSISYGTTLAIYAALRILKRRYAEEFETTELFRILRDSNYYPHTVQSTESNYAAYLSYNPTRSKSE
jgi:hypothetical protein